MVDDTLERLVVDTRRLAESRRRVPGATYRLQMHQGFPIADAERIVPYLDSLGVTHAYASSLLSAKPGSPHGYDVRHHDTLNPELGTEDELASWVAALQNRGMGLILDTVPNHMCVATENAWWFDVLENGPSSPYAGYFDIAWQDHPRERLHGKVLLPILGEPYARALESGQFQPVFEAGAFIIHFGQFRLPIDPRTYGPILTQVVESMRSEMGKEEPSTDASDLIELQSILNAIKHLPAREETDPARVAEGLLEAGVVKRRLAELGQKHVRIQRHIRSAVERLAGIPGEPGSFTALDQLLDAQAYRPCFWRVASDEINYRRFFDINDLAALSTEREEVFRATHRKIFEWLGSGTAEGLRIDHPDGLFDPRQYLERLQVHYLLACARHLLQTHAQEYDGLTWDHVGEKMRERFEAEGAGRTLYVVVEKILGHNESLPDNWPTDGTTGYEFMNAVNGLFVDAGQEKAITEFYRAFTGIDEPFDEIVYEKKFLILQSMMASELHMLAHQLDRLAQAERWSRDFTLNGLRHALREVIVCFPVYRSYVNGDVRDGDRFVIARAVRKARLRNPVLGRQVFDFIRDTLLLKDPPSGPATPEYRAAQRRFAGKFQQVTSPVMAKGMEDTAMYVYARLLSLNEVGGEPGHFGSSPARVHRLLRDRCERYPAALSPLGTHDHKRGEDVRARIDVLTEMPAEWQQRVWHWAELNRPHKVELEEGVIVPDPNEEYFLYQTLVGAWPIQPCSHEEYATFVQRIHDYLHKSLHEAKVHSSWINPNAEYDAAVQQFVTAILDPDRSDAFLSDLRSFQRVVSDFGLLNSLAQTLIRCTAPGVPDTYQGTELWDFSLVDPDNRRPVDFAQRIRWLEELDTRAESDIGGLLHELVRHKEDGRIKLYTVSRALRFRRSHPELFATGRYETLETGGSRADHLFAFARTGDDGAALVIVPRLVVGLGTNAGVSTWASTHVRLPDGFESSDWRNVLTGATQVTVEGTLLASESFAHFPVALLYAARKNEAVAAD